MTALARPDVALCDSWAVAMAELHREGTHVHGSGLWLLPEDERWDLTPEGCARLVQVLRAAVAPPSDPESDDVPCEFSWVVEEGGAEDGRPVVVGVLALRLGLNQWLLEHAGHVGYSIAPSHRGRGHASRALALAVRRAGELGLDRLLVTCDDDNLASAATIESGGGVLEDVRGLKRRYWIDTSASSAPTPAPTPGR
ncbi:GNAT family N-acetyltransferase [Nocardioides flavescens]|uniref:GNAT family N-acetyltransferase n=1 Tax=Nocardioides flavescens TaxID=2691959 RepID=A0A6L7ETX1_9ACTN|nr:GNAT family N-acetyltransferase [Nocardioides flavescens]MXG90150.1 GNAT family N-acetyltransferase [Nocardioides flavescens]